MTEPQKPFVHQDGTTTPRGPTPTFSLLNVSSLEAQVREIERARRVLDTDILTDAHLLRTIETLNLFRAPSLNTVAMTMASLDPTMQALVSDVVLALGNAGNGRQHLAIALRKLIEGRS